MRKIFLFKKKVLPEHDQKQKWWQKLIWFLLLSLLIISCLRITLIGIIIEDVFFEFIWGWLKYLLIIILFLFFFDKIFNNYFSRFLKRKNIILSKRKKIKIGWFIFNLILLLGFINILFSAQWSLNYSDYLPNQIITQKYTKTNLQIMWPWIKKFDNFFVWDLKKILQINFGGFLGLISASLFCYFHIFGGLTIWFISVFLMISYSINNSCWYYFYSKTKKEKIKWTNLNSKENYRIKTNIINNIDDQDMTIELQKAQKINDNDQQIRNNIDQTENILEKKAQEKIYQEEIIIEQKKINHDFAWKHEQQSNDVWDQKENDFNEEEIDFNEEEKELNQEKNVNDHNSKEQTQILPTFDIFEKDGDSLIYATKIHKNKGIEKIKQIYQEKIGTLFVSHKVKAKINNIIVGPRVIRYEIFLFPGTKVQHILSLEPELKLVLAQKNIFLESVSGGRSLIGIDVPIPEEFVIIIDWKETIKKLTGHQMLLPLSLGKSSVNEVEVFDLNKLPHLLIAGRTGGGKSVCLTSIIATLTYHKTPSQLKLLLIDPKRVELSIFKNLPHLLGPIITKTHLVSKALEHIIEEIEQRFQLFEQTSVRNLHQYNQKMSEKNRLPYLVIIIDELADLILRYRKEVEDKIVRIGQIARAAGIHMILATQRPSVNIITALIKANIPGRIAFSVTNNFDSRTIINCNGAEKLLGIGDMIFVNAGKSQTRIQGSYIKINDINAINDYWKTIYTKPNYYWKQFEEKNLIANDEQQEHSYLKFNEYDQKMYQEIKQYIARLDKISVSLLQRRFGIGFNRASKMIEKLESENLISKADGNKPRKVIKSN